MKIEDHKFSEYPVIRLSGDQLNSDKYLEFDLGSEHYFVLSKKDVEVMSIHFGFITEGKL